MQSSALTPGERPLYARARLLTPRSASQILLTCDILSAFCSRRVNVGCGPAEERVLLTGLHAVADIYCENCKTTLGWKYVRGRLRIHCPLVCLWSALVFLHDSGVLLRFQEDKACVATGQNNEFALIKHLLVGFGRTD